MNSETDIAAYFRDQFKERCRDKKKYRNLIQECPTTHPIVVNLATTYNCACAVLGADVADKMLSEAELC